MDLMDNGMDSEVMAIASSDMGSGWIAQGDRLGERQIELQWLQRRQIGRPWETHWFIDTRCLIGI